MNRKSVCVIGAGLSGLTSIKSMKDGGLEVTCFEKENHIGGMWNIKNEHCVPHNTITNITHIHSGFSDFPVPDDFPYYLTVSDYCRFFHMYAHCFDLYKHIKFGCEIVHVEPIYKDNVIQQWLVSYKSCDGLCKQIFDYLVISTGFYTVPHISHELNEMLKSFDGFVIHAKDYKNWKAFENKKVVVCGLGSSGGDIACDLSKHAKDVYISTSHGSYVIGRFLSGGKTPIELTASRFGILQYAPAFLRRWVFKKLGNMVYNHDDLRLTPINSNSVIFSDELCVRVAAGSIKIRSGIERTSGRTVYFKNGSRVNDVDAVILCTGYTRHFPFMSSSLARVEKNGKYLPTYKGVFLPKLLDKLAFVGFDAVVGSSTITSEMQARYATEVFCGRIVLPSVGEMERQVEKKLQKLTDMYGDHVKEYNFVPHSWQYYDELAIDIGCRPSLLYLFCTDPILAWNMLRTYSIHEYRLIGPNRWSGARTAILNTQKRLYAFMEGSRDVHQ